jgi:hypothetical protein
MVASKSVGFFVVPDARRSASRADALHPGWLEVPGPGASSLCRVGDSAVRLAPVSGAPPAVPAVAHSAAAGEGALRVESIGWLVPFEFAGALYLLLLVCGSVRPRINGLPACPVSVLRSGDTVDLGHKVVLHVSVRSRPYIGPPRDGEVGRTCPVCLASIDPASDEAECVVYVCPACGVPCHLKARIASCGEILECVRASSSCPSCGGPIVDRESHDVVPEL